MLHLSQLYGRMANCVVWWEHHLIINILEHPQCEAWWGEHHAVRILLCSRPRKACEWKMNAEKYRDILDKKTWCSLLKKYVLLCFPAKQAKSQDYTGVLEWLSPQLSLIQNLWLDLKMLFTHNPRATWQSLSSFAKKNGVNTWATIHFLFVIHLDQLDSKRVCFYCHIKFTRLNVVKQ